MLFAANVNTRFDSDPRRWRLLSSVALDASCLLELLAPAAPALFIPLAAYASLLCCIRKHSRKLLLHCSRCANVGKNISWLAASASRYPLFLSCSKFSLYFRYILYNLLPSRVLYRIKRFSVEMLKRRYCIKFNNTLAVEVTQFAPRLWLRKTNRILT